MSLASAERHIAIAEQRIAEEKKLMKKLRAEKKQLQFELTNKQIGDILGCSKTTAWRRIQSGKIKSRKAIDVFKYAENKENR